MAYTKLGTVAQKGTPVVKGNQLLVQDDVEASAAKEPKSKKPAVSEQSMVLKG